MLNDILSNLYFKENWRYAGFTLELAGELTQPVFICSKSIMGTPEQCVKSIQSQQ